MKRFTKNVCGIKTEFVTSDGGSDPIFIFHGNSSSASAYKSLMLSPVGRQYQIVSVSLPGHGGSAYFNDTNGILPIARIGEFTRDVISLFKADRYILVGQSLGGHALLESLSLHDKAIGLCLVSAPPFSSETIGDAFLDDPTRGLLFKNVLTEEEAERFARAFSHNESTETVRALMRDIRQTNGQFREELGVSLANGMIVDELQSLKASGLPTLLLQGEHDQFISQAYYHSLNQYDWPVNIMRFASAGHAIQLDSPQEFENTLSNFFCDAFSRDNALKKLTSSSARESHYADH